MSEATRGAATAPRRPPAVGPALHFVADAFVPAASGRTFETLDPATNEPITGVADGAAEDADRAVRAARAAFDDGPWPRWPAARRAEVLRRVADLIDARAEEIAAVECLDTGIPWDQIRHAQIPRAAENFRFFAEMALRLAGELFPTDGVFHTYTLHRPVGVAGLIVPWNTPFMLQTWKVAPCLAAGNTCVLKPAEWAPLSAGLLAEIVRDAGLPPGVFNVVHGVGERAGAAVVAHPGVQLISFTGETATGREIMRNGASGLKRFSMELGGKSPVVVFADADLDRALDAAIFGVFSLNGERCTAGSRLLVEAPVYDGLVDALLARVARIRIGAPLDPATELGPLIHPDHWHRVRGYMDVARAEGVTVAAGGDRPAGVDRGNYFAPTVLLGADARHRVFQEEIFGPVLCVTPFANEAEAVRLANAVRYGLAAYVWTSDVARAHRVAAQVEAGMVWVNSQNVRDLRIPFGGMKDSGIGREGGLYSFEFYTERQAVHVALGRHPIPRLGAG
ncbi:MAG: 5-carboxymethyl-2-hydroxymuconate semialdehyde dehydrogenase [Armatimonadota bacterium]|nr:5-carboxymethyl-2-hydroxymuconate semialdehyde dehydrogenase [Armatimonadota bacterium]MDR7421466.1 5-carboxymethyl-2-hydroxymuconate semialdehyde dehydrogenase [Armatimonadota bacterium]MDR7453058.1 5-carboxymethyl-2-hydroxymuconate semialdehyde dehydrogenase [Armatimonadota bacterium]MDR7497184.1 5-carboxymethyl-2-hydroxymuconate semialdehyde dehydrogenase [Armatimonadota bacterium]MDR7512809.1 5-carboxymethyl-2-hydroxymuconate semialdehyde dehydrogenase [Armatimonadota bacterium]